MSAALTLNPFWQLKILVQDDPDKLRSLPEVVDREALAEKIKTAVANPSMRMRLLRTGEGEGVAAVSQELGQQFLKGIADELGDVALAGVSAGNLSHTGNDEDVATGLSGEGDLDAGHTCPECEKLAVGFKKFLSRLQAGEDMGRLETECPTILKLLRRGLDC